MPQSSIVGIKHSQFYKWSVIGKRVAYIASLGQREYPLRNFHNILVIIERNWENYELLLTIMFSYMSNLFLWSCLNRIYMLNCLIGRVRVSYLIYIVHTTGSCELTSILRVIFASTAFSFTANYGFLGPHRRPTNNLHFGERVFITYYEHSLHPFNMITWPPVYRFVVDSLKRTSTRLIWGLWSWFRCHIN